MNLAEAISLIDNFLAAYDGEMTKVSEELATNAKSMIIHRIQTEGLEGREYSTQKLPNFFFEGWELNAGGKALLNPPKKGRKKKGEAATEEVNEAGISYTEWRRANGLQTDHVDLTYTGRMLQNIQSIKTEKRGEYYVTTVGAWNPENQQKMGWNFRRFGDFMKPTEKEKEILINLFNQRWTEFEQRHKIH